MSTRLVTKGQKQGLKKENGWVRVTELQHSGDSNIQTDIHTPASSDGTCPTNMVAVIFSSIPEYLRSSELYKSFEEGEYEDDDNEGKDKDQGILFPAKNFKISDAVSSQADLVHLCHTLRYWVVPELPQSIISAAFGKVDCNLDEVVREFGAELSYLPELFKIRKLPSIEGMKAAISMGSLELVRFFHEQQGCVFSSSDTIYSEEAARTGHLHILTYLHERGSPWHEDTIILSTENGHLDCLNYAHEHGCAWLNRLQVPW